MTARPATQSTGVIRLNVRPPTALRCLQAYGVLLIVALLMELVPA